MGRRALAYVVSWTVLGAIWALLALRQGASAGEAAVLGGNRALSAGLLGLGLWWVTGRWAWPEWLSGRFLALHSGFAVLFTVAHLAFDIISYAWYTGRGVQDVLIGALRFLPFDALTTVFLYGLASAVCYNLRAQERLREEALRAAQAKAAAAEAQLGALRSQLHPHFLYNALHSVAALVPSSPRDAERAIERLGSLLRYCLDTGPGLVPLEEEWRFTRDYLALEALRLGDRLRLDAGIDDDALDIPVPAFTLQMLAENAIRHAVAPRPEGGRMAVRGRLERGALHLTVQDDGPGVPPEAPDGLGLKLVRERLRLLAGEKAQLGLGRGPGGGCVASVVIPLR